MVDVKNGSDGTPPASASTKPKTHARERLVKVKQGRGLRGNDGQAYVRSDDREERYGE